jgi:hypothetical protein
MLKQRECGNKFHILIEYSHETKVLIAKAHSYYYDNGQVANTCVQK